MEHRAYPIKTPSNTQGERECFTFSRDFDIMDPRCCSPERMNELCSLYFGVKSFYMATRFSRQFRRSSGRSFSIKPPSDSSSHPNCVLVTRFSRSGNSILLLAIYFDPTLYNFYFSNTSIVSLFLVTLSVYSVRLT